MGKEIIDYSIKGNIVRFYLGEKDPKWGWTNKNCKYYDADDLEPSDDYYGDDWNDVPYEHNAGTVYPEFIKAIVDVSFGYDDVVIEPSFGYLNSKWCKDDMKARKIPCLIVIPESVLKKNNLEEWKIKNFEAAMEIDGAIKYYFGDSVSDIEYGKIIKVNVLTEKLPAKGSYRLAHIVNFYKGKLPISKGIALERKTADGNYYVILFIHYDEKEKSAHFDVVSKRLADITESEWPDVLELIKAGADIVEEANKKEEKTK